MNKENNQLNPPSTDFSMLDYECAYLPDRKVRMLYKYVLKSNKSFVSAVIERGWRRFGDYYFHPTCNGCNECKSIRIDVENYHYSKSQRKALKRNLDTKIIIREPILTQTHLDLYNKYHKFKEGKDNWSFREISRREYTENFVTGANDFGKEVLYIRDNQIVGVDLIDILDDGISSIYFYYDPSYSRFSLGTYSLLYQIKLAKTLNLKWIYLGYWVDGCRAFAYKPNFQPQEILDGFPNIDEVADWKSIDLRDK